MRIILFRLFFLFCVLLALPGCGKKGLLYLPDTAAAPANQPAAPQPTRPAQ